MHLHCKIYKGITTQQCLVWLSEKKKLYVVIFCKFNYVAWSDAKDNNVKKKNNVFVSGKPRITNLTKYRAADGKDTVLTCEAEGVPKPQFQWSVNNPIKVSVVIVF